jgi:aspartyl-tRNA synthetase
VLEAQALEKGLSLEGLEHYLDFFRYGIRPTAASAWASRAC